MNRISQNVIALGLAASDRGVSLGRLRQAMLEYATLPKTAPILRAPTKRGDTRHGLGYVDQWFVPSWVPKGCYVEKTAGYDYTDSRSRVRLIPITPTAKERLQQSRYSVELLCIC